MLTRRNFLHVTAGVAGLGLIERYPQLLRLSGKDADARYAGVAVETMQEYFFRQRTAMSFEASYTHSLAALPAVLVNVGTALKFAWDFISDIGSGVIADRISDWLDGLSGADEKFCSEVDQMLVDGGFPVSSYSRVYKNGQTVTYVRADEINVEICAPFITKNELNVRDLDTINYIPMLEGPEVVGMKLANGDLTRKGMSRYKRMAALLPRVSLNYPMPPAVFFNQPTVEPAVFETPDGFCGTDYQCDNDLQQGVIRVLTMNPYLEKTFEGRYAVDYSPVGDNLPDRAF